MRKIKMLCTRRGTMDGYLVIRFFEGGVYEVTPMLANRFLRMGWAVETDEPLNEIRSLAA